MFLLQAVERFLGSSCWPASIIHSLFVERPSPAVIEDLTAFFAGNGVPQPLAYKLFRACNPAAANELVHQLFFNRYSLCHSSDTVRSQSTCYDIRIKKLVWLVIPYCIYVPDFLDAETEIPVPLPGLQTPKLGVQNTDTPLMINTALEVVRRVQL